VHTTEQWPTVIGSDCVIGHKAHLESCTIEDRCLIGSGSVVLNRAVVRTGSVIGAQALVPEDLEIPAGHLALGVPARARPREDDVQSAWIDYGVHEYVGNARRYRHELRRLDR
jgi:carbonic anhydrase/acetyltransferase-like protein (isoleucine patch superfamily)